MKEYKPRRTKEELEEASQNAKSIGDILDRLGLRKAGGNHQNIKRALEYYNLPVPKYERPKGRPFAARTSDEEIFCEESKYANRTLIKKRLIQLGWEYHCAGEDCPNPAPSWRGKPITLQLEHKNGVANDNRLENLEFLCPNCHSQTDTYAGKSSRKKTSITSPLTGREVKHKRNWDSCPEDGCKNKKSLDAKLCFDHGKIKRYNKKWPDDETLIKMVAEHGYSKTARLIGDVSDVAVRKRYKKLNNG